MNTERLDLSVDDLVLDLENPRTGEVATQAEALGSVIKLSGKNFRNMMRSIKEHGLDPGDSFYLISEDEDDAFIVVDGNRRLAALKVLTNPLLLKGTQLSETVRRPLEKEAQGFILNPSMTVNCVLFENREDAGEWIERRHGRGLDGEGRIAWGPLEIQRFQNDRTILDVINFVERNSTFSDADWSRIKPAVEGNTSSLKRFLDSKAGRQFLGFAVAEDSKSPTFTKDPTFVIGVLSKIFEDIESKDINTRSYNKASDIKEYFDDLPKSLKEGQDKVADPQQFASAIVKDSKKRPRQAPKTVAAPIAKSKKITPVRKTLAPAKITYIEPETEKGKQLFREASKLILSTTPLACAFCFRAVIENSIDTYMRANSMPPFENGVELHLSVRLERVIEHLYAQKRAHKGDLTPIKATLTAKNGPMSIGALNGYIHSKVQLPTANELRVAWDHAVPLFTSVYGSIK